MRTGALWIPLFVLALVAGPAAADSDESAATGYLGIRLQRIEGGLAEALDLAEDSGVLVSQVMDDSPAGRSGLKAGDIIVQIDDSDVGDPGALRRVVRDHHEGDRVKVRYLRAGKESEVEVTLGAAEWGDDFPLPRPEMRELRRHLGSARDRVRELRIHGDRGFLGVSTQPLSEQLGEYFGVEDGKGALVSKVVEDSPAAKLGLKAGDVIVKLADRDIEDPGALRRAVRDFEEPETVEVVWVRDRKQKTGKVELEIREAGPLRWFDGTALGDADLEDLEHPFVNLPRVHREVKIERIDEEVEQELERLREELDELREQVDQLRGEK